MLSNISRNLIFVVTLSICPSANLFAQLGYSIKFDIKGLNNQEIFLGYYYGESTYIKDTAKVDLSGKFSYSGKEPLDQGTYMLVKGKTKLFEFLVGRNQKFSMTSDTSDYISNMKVDGDTNNEVLFENMRFNMKMNELAQPHLEQVRDSLSDQATIEEAQAELRKLNQQVIARLKEVAEQHKELLISDIWILQGKVDVPDSLSRDEQFGYYKEHFWDGVDLSNDALLRLPNSPYFKKMEEYLDNLFLQTTDSLIVGIEEIITKARSNMDTYKYAVWNLCIKYQNPKFMGQDGVFVYLYDQYFASGEMDYWANESLKNNLKERADQIRKSLLGAQAQNLIMLDENLNKVSLYDLKKKFTVIYFYDPDCGHCKKETPILNNFYNNTKHDVEVFAVSADTSMLKMNNYIKDMGLSWVSANGPRTITPAYQTLYDANSTPTIYLLDEKKRIIAKKIEAARLEEFLDNYSKLNN